jgi:cell division protein FtsN
MSKNKSQAKRFDTKAAVPFWVWILAGIFLGLAASGLVLYQDWIPALRSNQTPQPNAQAKAVTSSESDVLPQTAKPAEKPKYDFYSVLPEMEVVIPENEIKAQAQQSTEPTSDLVNTTEKLFLQTGSFKSQAEAEQMKAQLALSGTRASVATVNINGQDWFRVRLGPYSNARELDLAKRVLAESGIEAIALREK